MGVTAQQVWGWIGKNIWQILLAGSLLIQITPIKINPWSALVKWIGKTLTGDACNKIDTLVKKIDSLDSEVKENEKDRIRWEILDFANSCHHGRKHTKDEFQHIIELNDKYNFLLEKTKDKNGVFAAEYTYIDKLYKELNLTDSFLT